MKWCIVAGVKKEPYAPDHLGLRQGIESLGAECLWTDPCLGEEPRILAQKIRTFKPDIVLHHMTDSFMQKLPELIGKEINQVFWSLDYRLKESNYDGYFDSWLDQGKYLRHIFMSNYEQLDWWSDSFGVPTSYLPHGSYVPDKLEYDENFKYPCVFMGQKIPQEPYKNRAEFIEEIEKKVNIHHIGAGGSDRDENWKNMPKIYYSSDTVLDISHFWDVSGYCSGRFFYTSGLGGLAMIKRFPRCEELYPEDIKVYFNEPDEAIWHILYYQNNPDKREKIKQKAYNYGKEHHHYKRRLDYIYDVSRKGKSSKKAY